MKKARKLYLGINLEMDPSVAIVENGKVIAFSEEERHIRIKHAKNYYPKNAIKYCLDYASVTISEITQIAINWDITAYDDGTMESFYQSISDEYLVDQATLNWQKRNLKKRSWVEYRAFHEHELKKIFGDVAIPIIVDFPHHYTHAFHSYMQSGYDDAICITLDGSGDQYSSVVWKCIGDSIDAIYKVKIPHSLGWLYSAITEYLGFKAYDGEYKVMGLAAYGKKNAEIRQQLEKIVHISDDGIGYTISPEYIHYGKHTFSSRYTDALIDLLGRPPRQSNENVDDWHMGVAYELQAILERTVIRMANWAVGETGLSRICIGGGVGLNVKLNSEIFKLSNVDNVFPHPLCSDSGAACGAALLACYRDSKKHPELLKTLSLGYSESNDNIIDILKITKVSYKKCNDIASIVAKDLANGLVVGWFQGRMEAGPRALGSRSILANPTKEIYRDRVNAIVKFREEWRPFCPSILEEYAHKYFNEFTHAPFMVMAFHANQLLQQDAPAIVHIDGTSRVQFVNKDSNPLYHKMITSFYERTNVPVVLNTSFNVKGEPIVCTALDALRTFWGSGLDALAIGDYMIYKPKL
jgi:carbamoyltransferase